MAYRASSAARRHHHQMSVNPITGERIDYSRKALMINDPTPPKYERYSSITRFQFHSFV